MWDVPANTSAAALMLQRSRYGNTCIAVSLSTNSIRRQDPNTWYWGEGLVYLQHLQRHLQLARWDLGSNSQLENCTRDHKIRKSESQKITRSQDNLQLFVICIWVSTSVVNNDKIFDHTNWKRGMQYFLNSWSSPKKESKTDMYYPIKI